MQSQNQQLAGLRARIQAIEQAEGAAATPGASAPGDGMDGGAALWRSLFVELRDQPEPRLVVVIVGGFERVTELGRIVCGRLVCG